MNKVASFVLLTLGLALVSPSYASPITNTAICELVATSAETAIKHHQAGMSSDDIQELIVDGLSEQLMHTVQDPNSDKDTKVAKLTATMLAIERLSPILEELSATPPTQTVQAFVKKTQDDCQAKAQNLAQETEEVKQAVLDFMADN